MKTVDVIIRMDDRMYRRLEAQSVIEGFVNPATYIHTILFRNAVLIWTEDLGQFESPEQEARAIEELKEWFSIDQGAIEAPGPVDGEIWIHKDLTGPDAANDMRRLFTTVEAIYEPNRYRPGWECLSEAEFEQLELEDLLYEKIPELAGVDQIEDLLAMLSLEELEDAERFCGKR